MTRPARDTVAIARYKREKWVGGCEVCGWKPPGKRALAVHHVIPVACGGTDEPENLILLCPNHHALAHVVSSRTRKSYFGPTDKPALALALAEAYAQEVPQSFQKAISDRMRTLIDGVRRGESAVPLKVSSWGSRNRRAQKKTIRGILAQEKEGCTLKRIVEITGIDPMTIMGIMEDLYADGIAASIIVPDSREQIWFDISVILTRARSQ